MKDEWFDEARRLQGPLFVDGDQLLAAGEVVDGPRRAFISRNPPFGPQLFDVAFYRLFQRLLDISGTRARRNSFRRPFCNGGARRRRD